MPTAIFPALLIAIGAHRLLLLSLPCFRLALTQTTWPTLACGLASDLTLAGAALALTVLAAPAEGPRAGWRLARTPARWVVTLVFGLLIVAMAAQLRYAEHFGMTFRPYHVAALAVPGMASVGTAMTFESTRSLTLLAVSLAAVPLGLARARALGRRIGAGGPARRAVLTLAALAVAGIANGAVNLVRFTPGIHPELRYNILTAYYYNDIDLRQHAALPPPSDSELKALRGLLGGRRAWADGAVGERYPLWQTEVATGPAAAGAADPDVAWRDAVRRFLADEAAAKGPWNVVLLLSESLRAKELAALGADRPPYAGLTPEISALAAAGVTFTETIGAGMRTHYGQSAAGCSAYGPEAFTLSGQAPMTNAVCLSDIFAGRGYETHFFYAAANNYDNHDSFYPRHGVRHVHGEEHFPKSTVRGGWGYSDHALFQYTQGVLDRASRPFFATIMTLSNHAPIRIPADAPPAAGEGLDDLDRLIAYVDWTTGRFYEWLRREHPHTILVMIADHGHFRHETINDPRRDYPAIRDTQRIPWLIVVPELPAPLRGHRVHRLVSNVDVPPTLLSLLGWTAEPNQFMGEDAFTRESPVYFSWQGAMLALTQNRVTGEVSVSDVPGPLLRALGAAIRYDRLAPPRDED